MVNTYREWVAGLAQALAAGEAIGPPSGSSKRAPARPDAPKALLFAPHPDDEVIIGGLPLRLLRECGFAVVDVAVTLGSLRERQLERRRELEAACAYLGFGLILPRGSALEGINGEAQACDPAAWGASVEAIAAVLEAERPDAVFLPHAEDWNRTHVGVHHLVLDAMQRLPALACWVVETEFWGAMTAPNLMVESAPDDVADLVAALSLHEGEVARNPYHLRLPAWMMDNVRRGAELVGGQGAVAPRFAFATLYRIRAWRGGRLQEVLERGLTVGAGEPLDALFAKEGQGWK